MIHERDCPYCGTLAQWRSADPVPSKCLSCGAPPKRASRNRASGGPSVRMDVLYGLSCVRPDGMIRIGDVYDGKRIKAVQQDINNDRLLVAFE